MDVPNFRAEVLSTDRKHCFLAEQTSKHDILKGQVP